MCPKSWRTLKSLLASGRNRQKTGTREKIGRTSAVRLSKYGCFVSRFRLHLGLWMDEGPPQFERRGALGFCMNFLGEDDEKRVAIVAWIVVSIPKPQHMWSKFFQVDARPLINDDKCTIKAREIDGRMVMVLRTWIISIFIPAGRDGSTCGYCTVVLDLGTFAPQ